MAKSRKRRDPMDGMIESALEPGSFIGWNDLSGVEREIAKLVASEPVQAVGLYEAFIAACHEKAEEVNDSYGFCNDLERSAVRVFDRAGLEAFESEVRARFDKECAALNERKRPASPNPN